MRKIIVILLTLLALTAFANGRNEREVVLHNVGSNQGLELVYLDPPQVTYEEELNELTVYFGSTSTIDLECVDAIGPYYYIYGEYHYGNTSTTYYYLPAGYYTITIHSIYGVTYYGNFTVD
jgi:hypothetical protein